MNKERNCQACIHHISGLCSKWDCEMQTLEDYRNKVIDEFAEKLHDLCGWEEDDFQYPYLLHESRIDEIAVRMKAGDKDGK